MSGKPWPSWRLRPHGTEAAYRRHLRRGEEACPACLEGAARIQWGRDQLKRRQRGIS